MNDVASFRLSEKEKQIIENIANEEGKDKSEVAREVIDYGETFRAVKRYKQGKISVGKMASELDPTLAKNEPPNPTRNKIGNNRGRKSRSQRKPGRSLVMQEEGIFGERR